MAKKQVGGTPATVALTAARVPFTLHPYRHHPDQHRADSTSYGEEAVAALGSDPRRVFKTLIAEVAHGVTSELVVAVVPVATHLDLKALATALGAKKASMADPAAATRSTGYVLGGISPLGQRTPLRTVVDASALEFDTVLVSAGRRGLQVELDPVDLVEMTGGLLARIGS